MKQYLFVFLRLAGKHGLTSVIKLLFSDDGCISYNKPLFQVALKVSDPVFWGWIWIQGSLHGNSYICTVEAIEYVPQVRFLRNMVIIFINTLSKLVFSNDICTLFTVQFVQVQQFESFYSAWFFSYIKSRSEKMRKIVN